MFLVIIHYRASRSGLHAKGQSGQDSSEIASSWFSKRSAARSNRHLSMSPTVAEGPKTTEGYSESWTFLASVRSQAGNPASCQSEADQNGRPLLAPHLSKPFGLGSPKWTTSDESQAFYTPEMKGPSGKPKK